jgi:hypothetical protein
MWAKNTGICMEVWNQIWNTYQAVNFFQISMDFKLIKES